MPAAGAEGARRGAYISGMPSETHRGTLLGYQGNAAHLMAPLLLTWRPHDGQSVVLEVQVD